MEGNNRRTLEKLAGFLVAAITTHLFLSDKKSNSASLSVELMNQASAWMVVGPAATKGLMGLSPKEIHSTADEHRNRLHYYIKMLCAEIRQVTGACAEAGIPLAATLADLFLLQHQVKPPKGSPCDYAFETMIIRFFQKECDGGMRRDNLLFENSKALVENGHPELCDELRDKINAFNKVGMIAHRIYRTQKNIFFNLLNYGAMPVHQERYSRGDDLTAQQNLNSKQIERYIEKITVSVEHIEKEVLKARNSMGWEPHSVAEIQFRDGLISVLSDQIKAMNDDQSKQEHTKLSDDDEFSSSYSPR